jgi:hypothetical protein
VELASTLDAQVDVERDCNAVNQKRNYYAHEKCRRSSVHMHDCSFDDEAYEAYMRICSLRVIAVSIMICCPHNKYKYKYDHMESVD